MPLLERDAELELLRRAVASETRQPVRVLRAACDDLSTLAPLGGVRDLALALRGTTTADVLANESDVIRLGRALIGELSAPQAPALLVVEDVHWADSSVGGRAHVPRVPPAPGRWCDGACARSACALRLVHARPRARTPPASPAGSSTSSRCSSRV